MSLLVDTTKFRKTFVMAIRLAETEGNKILYFWSCGQLGHPKKDCSLKQMWAYTTNNPKRMPIVPTNNSTKEAGKYSPKWLKCFHYGRNNHKVENYFVLHLEKNIFFPNGEVVGGKVWRLGREF